MATPATAQTIDITGDMTFERATQVFNSINVMSIEHSNININLGGVNQSDSAALAIMLEWASQARKSSKTVSFNNVPDQLMRLIEMTHLERILNLESSK